MGQEMERGLRSTLGYGSSYQKGEVRDLEKQAGIGAVLGGQVWVVKPDKRAEADNPCIWMASGVIGFKNCNNFGDCSTCKYDMGMRKRVEQNQTISWQDAMRMREGLGRVCRHSLTGRIERRSCAYDYSCSRCDFDQFFEDVWTTKTKSAPYEVQDIKGFKVPMGYYYHNGHTWARIESGGYIRVGMDDFALKLLGGPDALDLPLMGKELNMGQTGWGMRRQDRDAEFLAPVNGVIMEVNSELREKPKAVQEEPYEEGWLFMIRTPDVKKSAGELMTDAEGMDWMNSEVTRLEHMIEDVAGPLAADGGYLGEDIYGNLPDLGWERLTKTFLKTS
jgi:glycine cleavage system H lipoate-binding protein